MNVKVSILGIVLLCTCICSCHNNNDNMTGDDIRLFKGPSWELAKAVEKEDTTKIKQILAEHKVPVDYQEPRYGETLLEWAVWTNHYNSSKTLLGAGANPNIQDTYDGYTPLTYAADKFETSKYIKLLLDHGAKVNSVAKNDSTSMLPTPLISAAFHRLESVKLLVDAGADINYTARNYRCALLAALHFEKIDIVRYLLIDKGATFNRPFGRTIDGKDIMITDLLRDWVYPLDSEKYRMKMEIVNYLKERGMDYWKTPVPEQYYKHYSKEYLSKY